MKHGVIDNTKNLVLSRSEHGLPTTLYDLKVFNYLVMRLDTDQAWHKKKRRFGLHIRIAFGHPEWV